MQRAGQLALMTAACVLLAACSGAVRWSGPGGTRTVESPRPPAGRPAGVRPQAHIVQAGDTLYAIAFRYGLSVDALATWNGLGDGSLIRVGQRLRLYPPEGAGKAGAGKTGPGSPAGSTPGQRRAEPGTSIDPPRWQWPVDGPLVARFGDAPLTASGVQLGGWIGAPVRAAAGGLVVYAGNGLPGYGELLIIKHNASWLSAYGYNQSLLVHEGDRVAAGQTIATMGEGPSAVTRDRRALLHFEIRQDGAPVDPLAELPPRP